MKPTVRVVLSAFCISGLLITTGAAQTAAAPPDAGAGAPEASVETTFKVDDPYTAQRRPRAAVFVFDNANQDAQSAKYGASVEAMLVTFLKRKSQFVVVERKTADLKAIVAEKTRRQFGEVKVTPDDKESQELLEKIDAFILGTVTILPFSPPPLEEKEDHEKKSSMAEGEDLESANEVDEEGEDFGESQEDKDRAKKLNSVPGLRVEIDLKLISRFDGRIIAAAQRSGPVSCLRSIVERLGIALEQEFLRPYYGKLTVTLTEPEHIRVFLTPILSDRALNEEKPPVELSATVTIGSGYDVVEAWTTDPTSYTIKNVLSGWYSMRIERPGYETLGLENSRWEVRRRQGKEVVFDRVADVPIEQADPADSRFVVRVDPLTAEVVDGNALGFKFKKQGGSLAPLVRRQYMDTTFSSPPKHVLLMAGRGIEINQLQRPAEYADDERCDLFEEKKPLLANYGRTYIATGEEFDFSAFKGGELIIEDYKGEVIPAGVYKLFLWEPSYHMETAKVRVRAGEEGKQVKTALTRETADLSLRTTGSRPAHQVTLEGRETGQRFTYTLDFDTPKELVSLPADDYVTTTNVTGLDGWQRIATVLSAGLPPPKFNVKSPKHNLLIIEESRPTVSRSSRAGVKTRFGLAGRLNTLSQRPDPLAADLFIDEDVPAILNLLLYGDKKQAGEEQNASGSPQRFPHDPDLLRRLLAERLEYLDLVVLNPADMVQLGRSPEVAAIFARYVASGGSLFAYVSEVGNYRNVIGAPLTIEKLSKKSKRLDLAPGEVEGLIAKLDRKDVKVKSKRALPEVADLSTPWRTLAYTRKGRRPRIIERGGQVEGGYVALWLDDPDAFRSRWGGTRPKVEETRGRVEAHVIQQARNLMRRRFDRSTLVTQPCTPTPAPSSAH
ncbi:MAG TPA: CsgG/HfaB family protein [Thermoanaerobaculia bacterium]